MDAFGLKGVERFVDTIRPYDNIERVIAGHLHRPIQCRLAGTMASTAPATAYQIALNIGAEDRPTTTFEPSACQLHLWLGGTDGLVSHTVYLDENAIDESDVTR